MDLGGGLCLFHSTLGWILSERIEQPAVNNNESSLLVSTVGSVPNGIKRTAHMLTSIDPSISSKPSLEDFWNLKSIGITDSPSQNSEIAIKNFTNTVMFADGKYLVMERESTPDLPQNYQLAVG